MLEVAGLFLIMFLVAATAFFPLGYSIFSDTTKNDQYQIVMTEKSIKVTGEKKMPEDSMLKRHFMTQLRAEVESSFGPRPTDSTLKRHHDTMVDAEFEKRLSEYSA